MIATRSFYVYALKDPTISPSIPFYVGKGTGIRAWEHELHTDESLKGQRIRSIQAAGHQVSVVKLVDNLTEGEALRIEAQIISAFGTIATGGFLTNAVLPTGVVRMTHSRNLVIPSGVEEKAQIALSLLKESILELAVANPAGVTNSDVSHTLGLQSDYLGGSKDYLAWSVLGLLMREGRMKRVENKRHQAQVR